MSRRIVTGVLLVLLGVVLGVLLTITGLITFVRLAPELAEHVAGRTATGFSDPLDTKHRLAQEENELKEAKDEYHRWLALTDLANTEVDAGSIPTAKVHAQEILRLAPKYHNDWNYGNAVHKGNLTMGRVALRESDIQSARKYLLEAGKTPGSPQLDSFGPNMMLAKELLDRGEKEVVLQYFDECGKFWEMGHDKLREWGALVKGGVNPDFGANLIY